MAINPPDLAYGIRQIITGATENDRAGQSIRSAFERVNFDLQIIADELQRIDSFGSGNGATIQSILADIAGLQSNVTNLQNTVTNHGNRITDLETEVSSISSQLVTILARISALELSNNQLVTLTNQLETEVTDLQALILTKANINSPTFTGSPALDSGAVPSSADDSTRLASTSWVRAYIATALSGDGFPPGTVILFSQANPPAGWSFRTGMDNRAIRLDTASSGTIESTGNTFTDAFRTARPVSQTAVTIQSATLSTQNATVTVNNVTGLTTNPHILTVDEIPSHVHAINRTNGDDGFVASTDYFDTGDTRDYEGTANCLPTGGGQGHAHSIPNHGHTTNPHNHTISPHNHTSPVHDHTLNLNVRYVNAMFCIKD